MMELPKDVQKIVDGYWWNCPHSGECVKLERDQLDQLARHILLAGAAERKLMSRTRLADADTIGGMKKLFEPFHDSMRLAVRNAPLPHFYYLMVGGEGFFEIEIPDPPHQPKRETTMPLSEKQRVRISRFAGYLEESHGVLDVGMQMKLENLITEIVEMERGTPPSAGGCAWTYDEDSDSWDETCGVKWTLTDGKPQENEMKFCPRCGAALKEGGG